MLSDVLSAYAYACACAGPSQSEFDQAIPSYLNGMDKSTDLGVRHRYRRRVIVTSHVVMIPYVRDQTALAAHNRNR